MSPLTNDRRMTDGILLDESEKKEGEGWSSEEVERKERKRKKKSLRGGRRGKELFFFRWSTCRDSRFETDFVYFGSSLISSRTETTIETRYTPTRKIPHHRLSMYPLLGTTTTAPTTVSKVAPRDTNSVGDTCSGMCASVERVTYVPLIPSPSSISTNEKKETSQ